MINGAEHGVRGMFAEKPVCCSLVRADAIKDAFEPNDMMLQFGPPRRDWSGYRQAPGIIDSGELDSIRSIVGFSHNSIRGHVLDTLLFLLQVAEVVVSIHGILEELHPTEGDSSNIRFVRDTGIRSALVEFGNGTTLHLAGTGIGYDIEVVYEEGIIHVQDDGESLSE